MKTNDKFVTKIVSLLAVFITLLSVAIAIDIPVGVEELTEVTSETINASQLTVSTHGAFAGNVTRIDLEGRTQTKHWQGYYGEVSGTIVLDDAQNYTLYDWPNAEPKGEIYALANSSAAPDWLNVACFNYSLPSSDGSTGWATSDPQNETILARWEAFYNMTWNDVDSINDTFNMTSHPTFSIGSNTIANGTCPNTYTHVSDAFQEDKFVEVLLQDEATHQLIFMTIIENDDESNNTDPTGFDDATHDFQMLVGEDGTSFSGGDQNDNPTTYYFYMDLE